MSSENQELLKQKITCPYCNKVHDCSTPIAGENAKPEPGNISMCIDCGEFSEFDDGLSLVKFDHGKLDIETKGLMARMKFVFKQAKRKA